MVCRDPQVDGDRRWTRRSGRRNTKKLEVAMKVVSRRSARSGRAPLLSPRRPSAAGRDEQNRFWKAIATGQSSEMLRLRPDYRNLSEADCSERQAACHQRCSDLRASLSSLSPGRHLSLPEREEIALLKVQGHSIRRSGAAWGGMLRRSPVNCGGTWPSAAASWSIGQQLPNGVQTDLPAGPSPTKLAINEPCALMWSGDLPAAL